MISFLSFRFALVFSFNFFIFEQHIPTR
jgi:hypothetical protein